MKSDNKIYALLLIGSFACPSLAWSSFEDIGTGARATALGGAYTAVADDVYSVYYNPAGLVYLYRKELSASYGRLYSGLSDNTKISHSYFVYGHPFIGPIGNFGVSYHQYSADDLYSEREVTLAYARRLTRILFGGLGVKQLRRSFSAPVGQTNNLALVDLSKTDPVFSSGDSRTNYSFDLGLLFRPYLNYTYGLSLKNINQPNMSIAGNDSDVLPMSVRSGLSYQEKGLTLLGELDTVKSPTNNRDFNLTAAGEKWWLGAGWGNSDLAARGSLGFGSRNYSALSLGVAVRVGSVQLDYGMQMPITGVKFGVTQGNHRFSFTLRFGNVIAEPDYSLRMQGADILAKKAELELAKVKEESRSLMIEIEELQAKMAQGRKAVEQEQDKAILGKKREEQYLVAMEGYKRKKVNGAQISERIEILNRIVDEFSRYGFNIADAMEELAMLKSDRAKSEVDLAFAWSYYQKVVVRGANIAERIGLLSQLVQRFVRTGTDLTVVERELKVLRVRQRSE